MINSNSQSFKILKEDVTNTENTEISITDLNGIKVEFKRANDINKGEINLTFNNLAISILYINVGFNNFNKTYLIHKKI